MKNRNVPFLGLDTSHRQDYIERAQKEQVNHMETKNKDSSYKQLPVLPVGDSTR